jgi:hypothetical protein
MLTYGQRKRRLPFGAGTKVALETGLSAATVTRVLKGDFRNPRVEIALAALMVPTTTVEEAFGQEAPERLPASSAAS